SLTGCQSLSHFLSHCSLIGCCCCWRSWNWSLSRTLMQSPIQNRIHHQRVQDPGFWHPQNGSTFSASTNIKSNVKRMLLLRKSRENTTRPVHTTHSV
ncbi:hypothetical protein INR49_017431, partial [Caranx melampygus]